MEIILLENVRNLGNFGAKVRVAKGYGRNYLIPQGKALPANRDNLAKFEARRAELSARVSQKLEAAQARAATLENCRIVIRQRAAEGRLYGSVGTLSIAETLSAAGFPVERHEICLSNGPIHYTGEYEITLALHTDVEAKVVLIVEAEK